MDQMSQLRELIEKRNQKNRQFIEDLKNRSASRNLEPKVEEELPARFRPSTREEMKQMELFDTLSTGSIFAPKSPMLDYDDAYICPVCGGHYLHHTGVELFARKEDSSAGCHVTVVGNGKYSGGDSDIMNVVEDSNLSGNPSGRRGGIAIHFECEDCGSTPTYHFAQHKGCTFGGWAFEGQSL